MLGELVFQFSRGKSRLLCWKKKKKKPFSGALICLKSQRSTVLSLVNIRQKKAYNPSHI
jgi:hypothetical protein